MTTINSIPENITVIGATGVLTKNEDTFVREFINDSTDKPYYIEPTKDGFEYRMQNCKDSKRGMYWAMCTLVMRSVVMVLDSLVSKNTVTQWMVSDIVPPNDDINQPHYLIYFKTKTKIDAKRIRQYFYPDILRLTPMIFGAGNSLQVFMFGFRKYIKSIGPNFMKYNIRDSKNNTTVNDKIKEYFREGKTWKEVQILLDCKIRNIWRFLGCRTKQYHETKLFFISGVCEKMDILTDYLSKQGNNISVYFKINGFNFNWDGYDHEDLVIVDNIGERCNRTYFLKILSLPHAQRITIAQGFHTTLDSGTMIILSDKTAEEYFQNLEYHPIIKSIKEIEYKVDKSEQIIPLLDSAFNKDFPLDDLLLNCHSITLY